MSEKIHLRKYNFKVIQRVIKVRNNTVGYVCKYQLENHL